MKKYLAIMAVMIGLGIPTTLATTPSNPHTETIPMGYGYTPISFKNLPIAIKDAIVKNYERHGVKKAFEKTLLDGSKLYKIILVNGEPIDHIVFFNEAGEEVNEIL